MRYILSSSAVLCASTTQQQTELARLVVVEQANMNNDHLSKDDLVHELAVKKVTFAKDARSKLGYFENPTKVDMHLADRVWSSLP